MITKVIALQPEILPVPKGLYHSYISAKAFISTLLEKGHSASYSFALAGLLMVGCGYVSPEAETMEGAGASSVAITIEDGYYANTSASSNTSVQNLGASQDLGTLNPNCVRIDATSAQSDYAVSDIVDWALSPGLNVSFDIGTGAKIYHDFKVAFKVPSGKEVVVVDKDGVIVQTLTTSAAVFTLNLSALNAAGLSEVELTKTYTFYIKGTADQAKVFGQPVGKFIFRFSGVEGSKYQPELFVYFDSISQKAYLYPVVPSRNDVVDIKIYDDTLALAASRTNISSGTMTSVTLNKTLLYKKLEVVNAIDGTTTFNEQLPYGTRKTFAASKPNTLAGISNVSVSGNTLSATLTTGAYVNYNGVGIVGASLHCIPESALKAYFNSNGTLPWNAYLSTGSLLDASITQTIGANQTIPVNMPIPSTFMMNQEQSDTFVIVADVIDADGNHSLSQVSNVFQLVNNGFNRIFNMQMGAYDQSSNAVNLYVRTLKDSDPLYGKVYSEAAIRSALGISASSDLSAVSDTQLTDLLVNNSSQITNLTATAKKAGVPSRITINNSAQLNLSQHLGSNLVVVLISQDASSNGTSSPELFIVPIKQNGIDPLASTTLEEQNQLVQGTFDRPVLLYNPSQTYNGAKLALRDQNRNILSSKDLKISPSTVAVKMVLPEEIKDNGHYVIELTKNGATTVSWKIFLAKPE